MSKHMNNIISKIAKSDISNFRRNEIKIEFFRNINATWFIIKICLFITTFITLINKTSTLGHFGLMYIQMVLFMISPYAFFYNEIRLFKKVYEKHTKV
ncbi:hypothetical protein B5723_15110 [Mammaliicoccus sciuri]|uniref:hypothetical protein n=1 Tax=Mammaliicoccus sciuri TaxID=1296 RepID=UPI0009FEE16E|nr:hypothetical protein [Mammaliicoccus sciuri]ORI00202.1 hypothetical protein B5723_15110 [Mammaliicoccus sciuri]